MDSIFFLKKRDEVEGERALTQRLPTYTPENYGQYLIIFSWHGSKKEVDEALTIRRKTKSKPIYKLEEIFFKTR